MAAKRSNVRAPRGDAETSAGAKGRASWLPCCGLAMFPVSVASELLSELVWMNRFSVFSTLFWTLFLLGTHWRHDWVRAGSWQRHMRHDQWHPQSTFGQKINRSKCLPGGYLVTSFTENSTWHHHWALEGRHGNVNNRLSNNLSFRI